MVKSSTSVNISNESYKTKSDKQYYRKHRTRKKIIAALNKYKTKRYIIIRSVLSKQNATACISQAAGLATSKLQGRGRRWDQFGSMQFTNYLRNLPLKNDSGEQFKTFYEKVGKCIGMENVIVGQFDKTIVHDGFLDVISFLPLYYLYCPYQLIFPLLFMHLFIY